MTERRAATKDELESYLNDHSNWGRWGEKGGAGAMNLITPEKRLSAVALVKTGRTVSLSRPVPVKPTGENPHPTQHYIWKVDDPGWGRAEDFYGMPYHGQASTHLDALCHIWSDDGMWEGRDPSEEVTHTGARHGAVDEWSDGILTRGILLDVPKFRGKPFVTQDEPVQGWELEEIVKEEDLTLAPGDAVMVYCGREEYAKTNGGVYCDLALFAKGLAEFLGLHASCLSFIRNNDISILGWDMMDDTASAKKILGPRMPAPIHVGAIASYGVALLDNALLQPLAEVCAEESRYEFLLTINPLNVIGGTGSPVNPIAVF